MVAPHQQVAGVGECRAECLLHQTDLLGKRLQAPQCTFGLVEMVYLLLNAFSQTQVYW